MTRSLDELLNIMEGILLDNRPDAMSVFGNYVSNTSSVLKTNSNSTKKKGPSYLQASRNLKKAVKKYNGAIRNYQKVGQPSRGEIATPKQVQAKARLQNSSKNLSSATKVKSNAKQQVVKVKGKNKFSVAKSKVHEELSNLLEEMSTILEMEGFNTGISGMMDTQPINLAGKEMPSKENKHRQKKGTYLYKYKKYRSKANKSIVESVVSHKEFLKKQGEKRLVKGEGDALDKVLVVNHLVMMMIWLEKIIMKSKDI